MLVNELRKRGRNIVNLTLGEPDLDTPGHILDAAEVAMRGGDTHYTDTAGTPALRAAIAGKLLRDNRLDYSPRDIVVGSGGKHVIFHALAVTLDPGDEVVVHAPRWVSYPDLARFSDGVPG